MIGWTEHEHEGIPMDELQAIEARIWALLKPYRSELEEATIYGLPSLRWPGAKAHDYFASVNRSKRYVSLYLLVPDAHPEVLEGASEGLLTRRAGRATFRFPDLPDELEPDLAALLARSYERYAADHRAA